MAPASRSVPGSPSAPMRRKPLENTPAAPPRLLVKYSIASDAPAARGCARTSAVLIKGNVLPSSTDCGRIRRQATPSLAASASHSLPREGSSAS